MYRPIVTFVPTVHESLQTLMTPAAAAAAAAAAEISGEGKEKLDMEMETGDEGRRETTTNTLVTEDRFLRDHPETQNHRFFRVST
ncbi:hypothetical protein FF1_005335 [Malus domestica]